MKEINSVMFSLFSPEQVRKMSMVKITLQDTYDEDGYPIQGGLADQRLGVIDPGLKCKTCGGRISTCPGHFGHIELVRPVVHVGFGRAIYQLLKATCRKCGKVMVKTGSIDKVKRAEKCPHCEEHQKQVRFIKPTSFYEEDTRLLQNEVRERLEKIPDEDLREMGVRVRPENMVLTCLIVPPVTVRPSITLETGERSEDDLTHKLVDILRINQRLGENIDAGAPQLIIEDLWELLQYHVTTFFDNETAGIPPARHRSGRQLKTLFQRLKGKEGRFRYNLSGKRVNYSARTVISPDPYLKSNELGVPEEIAKELTLPLAVTEYNLEEIKEFVKNNSEKINYVIRPDGKRRKITQSNLEEVLQELSSGFTLERQLIDGDPLVFNRQPSLHRISMMCHKAKILPGKTLRFNVLDCRPYNADFDGDEMNIHVPQNAEAQSEAEILMAVQEQMLSPRNGEPIIGLDLDYISGIFLMTSEGQKFNREEACTALNAAEVVADIKGSITGRELFSFFLPKELEFEGKNRSGEQVRVKNGQLTAGTIDSRMLNALTKKIFIEFGSSAARDFVDKLAIASDEVLTQFGLSISLEFYKMNETAKEEIKETYKEGREQIKALIKKYKEGKLEREPGKTMRSTFEERVMRISEDMRSKCGEVVRQHLKKAHLAKAKHLTHYNPAIFMSRAGAKGALLNIISMSALVGQQAVRGKRVRSGYKNRVLSHYKKGDLSDAAKGFVKRSYADGLTPYEYFFHACGGRDSVVDKGVNPAKTGYMQRRLINAMQDLIVTKDKSVRDAENNVVQFLYGDDGLEPTGKDISSGEPVGVVAAQSIGEPGTQMTLRTFHYAGVASLAQLGFTRLVEIVDARKTPKNPVMEVYLNKGAKDYEAVKKIASKIEEITLDKIASIEENFESKSVSVKLDEQAMKDLRISEDEVLEKIKEITAYEKRGSALVVKKEEESLKNLRKLSMKLGGIHLRGLKGISRAIIIEKEEKGKHGDKEKEIEYAIATEGTNLEEILKIPEVDASRTTTNDIAEIARVFGIEAGRNAIVEEIRKVMEAQELKVDMRHIMLIADAMTYKGAVKSVGRHGLAGEKKSVLARAAFEETSKHLLSACVAEESDDLKGVTENILIGQTIPVGTGTVEVQMKIEE